MAAATTADPDPHLFGAQHRPSEEDDSLLIQSGNAEGEKAELGEAARETPARAEKVSQLGRIRVFRLGSLTLHVGPHWYFSLIMLVVIDGVGLAYTVGIAAYISTLQTLLGVAVTAASTLTFLHCVTSNPGILEPAAGSPGGSGAPEQWMPSTGKRHCDACNVHQPAGALHCGYCQVCILGWDHHCPWMSKCIGRDNLSSFYRFLAVNLLSLAWVVLVTLLSA
eukprot:TRINITY_DN109305_c0_g1_i1.p1 TRINITY_DN109305_c0_g1~~TRINITY_DN109305_c0_g1_i1.p1  ORF type:complete len:231 (+),score=39.79 TRINITY_DN109305_c0_g1_i1:27-695(+)